LLTSTQATNGHAIVRASSNAVALALTCDSNGDLEVVLPLDACKQLIAALQTAVSSES
jgi:hypothetical protein